MEHHTNHTVGSQAQEPMQYYEPTRPGGRGWKITGIAFILLFLVAAAGAAIFFFMMGDQANKVTNRDDRIKTIERDLATCQNSCSAGGSDGTGTGTGQGSGNGQGSGSGQGSGAQGGNTENFADFYTAATSGGAPAGLTLTLARDGFVRSSTDGNYRIAVFGATGAGNANLGKYYFYRGRNESTWTYSKYSGATVPACSAVSEAEVAAFAGVVECRTGGV